MNKILQLALLFNAATANHPRKSDKEAGTLLD
jgi:hypothetical protein